MCPVEMSQEHAIKLLNTLRQSTDLKSVFDEMSVPVLKDVSNNTLVSASAWLRVFANCLEGHS